MKKNVSLMAMAMIMFVLFTLSGCDDDNNSSSQATVQIPQQKEAGINEYGGDFSPIYGLSETGNPTIKFDPESVGMVNDGFMVENDGKKYFLPENESLELETDKKYSLLIFRVFSTEKGLVIGEYQEITVNENQAELGTISVLAELDESKIYSYLLPPDITINFPNNSISINPYIYQGPPIKPDDIEVEFSGFIRADIEPIWFYVQPKEEILIPSGNYGNISASVRIKDAINNRVLKSKNIYIKY